MKEENIRSIVRGLASDLPTPRALARGLSLLFCSYTTPGIQGKRVLTRRRKLASPNPLFPEKFRLIPGNFHPPPAGGMFPGVWCTTCVPYPDLKTNQAKPIICTWPGEARTVRGARRRGGSESTFHGHNPPWLFLPGRVSGKKRLNIAAGAPPFVHPLHSSQSGGWVRGNAGVCGGGGLTNLSLVIWTQGALCVTFCATYTDSETNMGETSWAHSQLSVGSTLSTAVPTNPIAPSQLPLVGNNKSDMSPSARGWHDIWDTIFI